LSFLSIAEAVFLASTKVSTTIAFIFGLTFSICSIVSLQISSAEICFVLKSLEISLVFNAQSS